MASPNFTDIDSYRRTLFAVAAVVISVLLTGCASSVRSGSHCSVEPGFVQSTTYQWRSNQGVKVLDDTGYISPTIAQALQDQAIAELAGKGFVLSAGEAEEDSPGLQLQLTLRVRRELASTRLDGGTMADCRFPDCFPSPQDADSWLYTRTIGFLAADAYVAGEPIWRGWVEQELRPSDRDNADEVLQAALPLLFETFPP